MGDLIDDLLDLQKQASTEKSHYYTANLLTKAIQEIVTLRELAFCQSCGKALSRECPECKESVVKHGVGAN